MDSRQKLEYLSFELLIGNRLSAGYPVTVVESPAGEGEAHMALAPDDLQDAISALERANRMRDSWRSLELICSKSCSPAS